MCFMFHNIAPSISYGKSPLITSSKSPFEDGVLRWNDPPRGATDRVSGFRRHLFHWKAIISGELQKDEALIWKLPASSAKHIFFKA